MAQIRGFVVLVTLALTACSGKGDDDAICSEGQTQLCTCVIAEGRVLGEQTCSAGAWGDCACGDAPRDGGMVAPRDAGVFVRDAGPRDGGLPPQCSPLQTRPDEECVAAQVAAGARHTCVIRAAGELTCFGDDTAGQLGRGDVAAPDPMAPWAYEDLVVTATAATLVEARGDYTCYLDDLGIPWCFGSNEDGKLGSGQDPMTLPESRAPVRVGSEAGFVDLALGLKHACAIEPTSQALFCWGSNSHQQLGRGEPPTTLPFAPDAKKVEGLMEVAGAAAGDGFTCVFNGLGRVRCLGKNSDGQLGDGTMRAEAAVPTLARIPAGRAATAIVAGVDHVCALLDDTTVYCWGSNIAGQVGLDQSTMESRLPVRVDLFSTGAALDEVTELVAGERHTCARRMDRSIVCWGDEITLCDPKGTNKPVRPRSFFWYGTSSRAIATGGAHSCAIRNDRGVHCFGDNTFGQSDPATPNSNCEHDQPVSILLMP